MAATVNDGNDRLRNLNKLNALARKHVATFQIQDTFKTQNANYKFKTKLVIFYYETSTKLCSKSKKSIPIKTRGPICPPKKMCGAVLKNMGPQKTTRPQKICGASGTCPKCSPPPILDPTLIFGSTR